MDVNRIIQGDSAKELAKLPASCIDLTVTSPYDNLRKYNGFTFDFETIAKELYRVTKPGGVLVWVVGDATVNGSETGTSFRQALYFKEIGFNLHDTMIYYKEGLTLNHNRYEQEFEYMFVFSKGSPTAFNPKRVPCKWFGKDSDRTGQFLGKHSEIMKRARSGKARTNIKPDKIKGNIWKYQTGYGHSTKDKQAFKHPAVRRQPLSPINDNQNYR